MRPAAPSMEAEIGGWLNTADLKVNVKTREVIRGDSHIELTPKEYDLLLYLLKNKRQVLSRDQILGAVWGMISRRNKRGGCVYPICSQKLEHGFETPLIHTVRGVGYVMKEAK